jgi:protein bicaudal D
VEYEATKHENRRLREDLEELSAELEELGKLKKIVEKNLEEALGTLAQEREQKNLIKKELDQRITAESLYDFHTYTSLSLGDSRLSRHPSAEGQEGPTLKRIEADFLSGSIGESGLGDTSPHSLTSDTQRVVGDLFSEIHVTEVRKLEKRLEDIEIEKAGLERTLEGMHQQLEQVQQELATRDSTIEKLKAQIGNSSDSSENVCESNTVAELRSEIDVLRSKNVGLGASDEELLRLQIQVANQEEQIARLNADLTASTQLAAESQGVLSSTQDDLVQVTEDIAQLYHLVCEVNGETPNRLMLEHVRGKRCPSARKSRRLPLVTTSVTADASKVSVSVSNTEQLSNTAVGQSLDSTPSVEQLDTRKSDVSTEKEPDELDERGDPIACGKLVETIHDQIKYLRSAVEKSVELSRQRQNESSSNADDAGDMIEQIVKLKAALSTKREQVCFPMVLFVCRDQQSSIRQSILHTGP